MKKERLYRRIAMTILISVFLLLILLGVIGLIKQAKEPDVKETMAASTEEMQILDDLKKEMTGRELAVILDAGHGGRDVGTGDKSYWEKDINLDIVKNMYDMLTYCGVTVYLTRTGDDTMELSERSAFANEHEDAAYFVSVHCNFLENDDSVSGLETYYWENSEEGKHYAQAIADIAGESPQISIHGVKTDNFHVLRETKMPAVLIETGYLSNTEDKDKLYDAAYQKTLAVYLVKGIIEGN